MTAVQFSIVITCFNQAAFIREAVDSALSLRSDLKEVIVVDDGSTDASGEILKGYGDSIRLASFDRNQGASVARNHGAAMARGEYLVFLDGDDVFLPWALEVYERIVETKHPMIVLACLQWFQGAVSSSMPADSPHQIQMVTYADSLQRDRGYAASSSTLVVDRQTYHVIGGWDLDLRHNDDHDVILRMGRSGPAVQVLSPPTVLHRQNEGSLNTQVHRAIGDVYKLFGKERNGKYPGGRVRQFERNAILGGYVVYWTRRAIRSGLYGDAVTLLARGWPKALATITRRFNILLRGRRPSESLAL